MLGPNGAVKTTTIRMLCCLIAKTSGEAMVAGYPIGNDAHTLAIRQLIGLVPDNVAHVPARRDSHVLAMMAFPGVG